MAYAAGIIMTRTASEILRSSGVLQRSRGFIQERFVLSSSSCVSITLLTNIAIGAIYISLGNPENSIKVGYNTHLNKNKQKTANKLNLLHL